MEVNGIRIPTIIAENSAVRCDGCSAQIHGTPFRISVLDIIATEVAPSFGEASPLNPGPFQFCANPSCPLRWMTERGWLFCRRSGVREIMRPIRLPAGAAAEFGLCDGLHHDAHEFLPA
ncbi:MAG: hypothetical protein KGN04_00705 [Chloroflexi bacterium]|jgi:hypothetical protein|nr:hypothetical protein [Chloroflexota bacterium]